MNRKEFIKHSILGSAAFALPSTLTAHEKTDRKLKIGICTDIHKDIMHDADARLEAFINEAMEQKYDFIIQLGDFCCPYERNLHFLSIWNRFEGKKYHVLGNHDMDGGFTFDQTLKFWNAGAPYYSFDANGFHFTVLNGNEKDESPNRPAGYSRFISNTQLDWLEKDLHTTTLPTFVFCHQGLDNDLGGIHNATNTRLVLETANKTAEFQKVKAVFSGHHHQDYLNVINGIQYIQINSMSYNWLGDRYQHIRYSEEIDKTNPWIKYTVPYQEPIWASAEISAHEIIINGKKTDFVGPSPKELGVDTRVYGYPIVSGISDRKIKF